MAASDPIDVLCIATGKVIDLKPWRAQRRALDAHDVLIDVHYCGICHSDLHHVKGDMAAVAGAPPFPAVPGHELAGTVSRVGAMVSKFAVGDAIGVGCLVDSCGRCAACVAGEQQKCRRGMVATYGSRDTHGRAASPCGYTLGGYTNIFVVHEDFGIRIPRGFPLEAAGPIMCSGVTLYDPLRRYGRPGDRVGVVGLGGLGVIGIKIARAMGFRVTAITRSANKSALAMKAGADRVVLSDGAGQLDAAAGTVDLLLNCVPDEHDYVAYNVLLSPTGRQVVLGLNSGLVAGMAADALTCGRSSVVGSGIGGIPATQAVIDLCAEHGIRPEIEVVGANDVNHVYERLAAANASGVRYVLDAATLTEAAFKQCSAPPAALAPGEPLSVAKSLRGLCALLCCGAGRRGRRGT